MLIARDEFEKIAKKNGLNIPIIYNSNGYEKVETLKELEGYIELLPKTINIKSCYDEADYFCLPSFYEGTPNVICEAISCGIPVLCSDICDNSLYVVDGQNGILFDPYSSKNIANAIVTAIEQTDIEYTSYSLKSRLIAEEKLSKTKFINQYIEIITENNRN